MAKTDAIVFHDFFFASPEVLLFFVAVILIFLWKWNLYQLRRENVSLFYEKGVVVPHSALIFWSKTAASALVWLLLIFALAQPEGNGRYPPLVSQRSKALREPHQVILVLDASASMGALDGGEGGESRLAVSKEIADQIVSDLDGQSVALYAFTTNLIRLSPDTYDYPFVRMMIEQIELNEGESAGTDFSALLEELQSRVLNRFPTVPKSVVIFSDGEDTEKEVVTVPRDSNTHFYTVGIGTPQGAKVPDVTYEGHEVISKLNQKLLREIAGQGKGKYLWANRSSPLYAAKEVTEAIFKEPFRGEGIEKTAGEIVLLYDRYYTYPLGFAIVLLGFILCYPNTTVRKFLAILLCLASPCVGEGINRIQSDYDAGEYELAQEALLAIPSDSLLPWQQQVLFYDLGTIALGAGDFKEALNHFQGIVKPSSPALEERLANNQGIAALKRVESLAPIQTFQGFQDAVTVLKNALERMGKNGKLNCDLKKVLNRLLEKKKTAWLTEITLAGGGREALNGIERILKQVNRVITFSLNKDYQTLYSAQQKSWLPFWEALEKGDSRFKVSGGYFREGIDLFRRGKIVESRDRFEQARRELTQLLKQSKPIIEEQLRPQKESKEESHFNEVLRQLQRMEQEDRGLKVKENVKTAGSRSGKTW